MYFRLTRSTEREQNDWRGDSWLRMKLFYYYLDRLQNLNTFLGFNLTLFKWDSTSRALSMHGVTTSTHPRHGLLHALSDRALQIQLTPTLAWANVEFE